MPIPSVGGGSGSGNASTSSVVGWPASAENIRDVTSNRPGRVTTTRCVPGVTYAIAEPGPVNNRLPSSVTSAPSSSHVTVTRVS
jgi:hypothetical protein